MLARPVIRAPLPSRPARLPSGFTVLDRSGHHLVVLDRTLAPVARIPATVSDGRLGLAVSADGSLAAVAGLDRTVVTAADGTIVWQRESVIKPQGLPQTPAAHIDRDGRACGSTCPTGTTLPCSTPALGRRLTAGTELLYRGRRVRGAPRRGCTSGVKGQTTPPARLAAYPRARRAGNVREHVRPADQRLRQRPGSRA
jgi:hypothetical protein